MAASHTTNLNLNKPARQDFVSVVTDINDNMDIIDAAIGALPSGETVQGQIDELGTDKVPATRTVNGKALSADVTLYGSDINMNSGDSTKVDDAITALQGNVADLQETDEANYVKLDGIKANSENLYLYKEASGDVVEVYDAVAEAVKQMQIEIAPLQDLHGYEYPWVGGSGKNLLNPVYRKSTGTESITYETAYSAGGVKFVVHEDGTITATSDGTITGSTINVDLTGDFDGNYYFCVNASVAIGDAYIWDSTTNGRAKKWDGTTNIDSSNYINNLQQVKLNTTNSLQFRVRISSGENLSSVTFKPMILRSTDTDTTWNPYSNICPISGWTGANVTRTGKNYADPNDATWRTGYYLDSSGVEQSSSTYKYTENYIPLSNIESLKCTIDNLSTGNSAVAICFYNANKQFIERKVVFDGSTMSTVGHKENTITVSTNACYIRYHLANNTSSYSNPVIESIRTYSITFPSSAGTVYGGTLTVNQDGTGTLVVDRANLRITNENQLRSFNESTSGYYSTIADGVINDNSVMCISDSCIGISFADRVSASYVAKDRCYSDNQGKITIRTSNTVTLSSKTEMFNRFNGATFVYYITPVTYTLTTSQVLHLLSGYNTVYADCGDLTILYPSDAHQTVEQAEKERIHQSITTSASVQTFTDGADNVPMGLKVGIEPVQNLHGYEYPWPGGAGKNLLDTSNMSTETKNGVTFSRSSDGVITVGGNNTGTTVYRQVGSIQTVSGVSYICTGTPTDGSSQNYRMTIGGYGYDYGSGYTFTGDGDTHTISIDIYAGYPTSGTTLTFKPMIRLASVSDDTYAPYSNICPISGRTGVDVVRTGKNLATTEVERIGYTIFSTGEGQNNTTSNYIITKPIPLVQGNTYRESYTRLSGTDPLRVGYYDSNLNFISRENFLSSGTALTVPSSAKYLKLSYKVVDAEMKDFQIEEGSTATAYEPFGHTYSITFPSSVGTVYGGNLTVNKDGTGTLVVDSTKMSLANRSSTHITDINATYDSGKKVLFWVTLQTQGTRNPSKTDICSIAQTIETNGTTVGFYPYQTSYPNSVRFVMPVSIGTTAQEIADFLTANEAEITYKLTTPITYTIPALVIRSLLGTNCVFADTGDVIQIDYSADIKTFVENLFSTIIPAQGISF